MRFLKLGLISVVAFSIILWGITLMFPSVTVLSRVRNIAGEAGELKNKLNSNEVSYRQWLLPDSGNFDIRTSDISFYENNLFNAAAQPNADTIYFEINQKGNKSLQGGIGFYQLRPDSVTTQLFYVFTTPWYRPLDKLKMMMIDKQYDAQMEGALQKLYNLNP